MSPDQRRRSIVAALVPLLLERDGDLTTSEIARAAGVAEGTIFRAFADKRELMLAAAEEAINPADGAAAWDELLASPDDLHTKVVRVAHRVIERMRLTMAVMIAIRGHLNGGEHRGGGKHPGPPAFVLEAQAELHRHLTALFDPHREELAVEPAVAAMALRSLVFGASRPELGMAPAMTPEQIADLLLDGVRTRES